MLATIFFCYLFCYTGFHASCWHYPHSVFNIHSSTYRGRGTDKQRASFYFLARKGRCSQITETYVRHKNMSVISWRQTRQQLWISHLKHTWRAMGIHNLDLWKPLKGPQSPVSGLGVRTVGYFTRSCYVSVEAWCWYLVNIYSRGLVARILKSYLSHRTCQDILFRSNHRHICSSHLCTCRCFCKDC